jgi:Flp pilus assembly protein TadG
MLPLLLILLFGGIEAGHFVWTQHKLAEAVRDGARYAARLPLTELCDGATEVMTTDTEDDIILMTRTGQVANAAAQPKVPGWTADQVDVDPNCGEYVTTGFYAAYAADFEGAGGPVVVVSTTGVPYPSMFDALGIIDPGARLSAHSISPGIGL